MLGLGLSDAAVRAARSMTGYPTPTLDLSMMHGVLDSRVSFTRASSATYTDSAGVLRTQGYNLLLRSEEFDQTWAKTRASVVPNAAIAPNGALTADKLVEDATASNSHLALQSVTGTPTIVHTFSVYAKAAERSYIHLQLDSGGTAGGQVRVSLTDGTTSTPAGTGSPTVAVSNAGGGWWRIAVTAIPAASGTTVRGIIYISEPTTTTYTGDGVSGIYIWGAQLEASPTASDYSATTTAANSAPRFDHAITTPTVNYLTFSEQFDNAAWVKSQSSVTPDAAVSPTGAMTADKLIENSATGVQHFARQTVAVTAGTTYVQSVYVKAAERFRFRMELPTAQFSANERAIYDLSTQAITNTGGSPTITSVGNGWYRLTLTGACTTSGSANCIAMLMPDSGSGSTYDGNGASGILVWGAQLEQSSTAGTYVPTSGIPARIGGSTTNLLLQSNSFGTSPWTVSAASLSAAAGVGPDGSVSAWKLIEAANSSEHFLEQSAAVTAQSYVMSVYAKSAERTRIVLRVGNFGTAGPQQAAFTLTGAGSFSTLAGTPVCSITALPNGWYRCAAVFTATSAQTSVFRAHPYDGVQLPYAGDGTSGVLIHGAQLETGSTLGPYVATTTAAATVNVTEARGLLIEEARTNLLAGDMTNTTTWTALSSTRAGGATAPDGSTNGVTFTENAGGVANYGFNSSSATITASTPVTASIFAKAGTGSFLRIILADLTTPTIGAQAYFNLSAGTVGTVGSQASSGGTPTGISATISHAGGGWYRCTLTAALATSTTAFLLGRMVSADSTGTDTGGKTMSLFGPQIEVGAFATSYIPSTATASRAADVAVIGTLTPWFNASEGTLMVEASRFGAGAFGRLAQFDDGTTSANSIAILTGSAGLRTYAYIGTANVSQFDTSASANDLTLGVPAKAAIAYKANDAAFCFNGGGVSTDTSVTLPTVTQLRIGAPSALHGHVRRVKYFNSRLANATLQSITL